MQDSEYEYTMKVSVDNSTGSINKLYIEPWGDELTIKPNDKIVLIGKGPLELAEINMEYKKDYLVIYAWSKSTITVLINGELQDNGSSGFPSM